MSETDIQLGDLTKMVGVELRIAQILADQLFATIQTPKMASGHYSILALISQNPGINQSTLARCMYLDRSSMVPILDRLEKKSWLERRKVANDRRAYALHLTRQGKSALEKADIRVRELERKIAEQMGKKNRDQLLTLTQRLQAALINISKSNQKIGNGHD